MGIMRDMPSPSGPEALLAHADFVRALARSLLFEEADAEDVAQEAWLVSLRARPREIRRPRAWLATVVRNLARDLWRRERRRAVREESAARPEAVRSTEEVVQREAVRRRVVEAVLALEEPCRSAVLFRFYDDLPPREIAARLGVPVETVKSHLKRGLARLRTRLDSEHGGQRSAWGVALLPLAGSPPDPTVLGTVAAGAAAGGALVASKGPAIALAGALVVLAGALLVPRMITERGAADVSEERARDSARRGRPLEGRESRRPEGAVDPAATREEEPARTETPAAAGPRSGEAPAARARSRVLVGRVLDPEGSLVGGASVIAIGYAPGPSGATVVRREALSGDAGRFRLEAPPLTAVSVFARRLPMAPSAWVPVQLGSDDGETTVPDLRLQAGGRVSGTVVDPSGRPVASARVIGAEFDQGEPDHFFQNPEPDPGRLEDSIQEFQPNATCGADGRWEITGVPAGEWVFRGTLAGFGPAYSFPVRLEPGGSCEGIELRLAAEAILTGVVRDPSGRAVGGARVQFLEFTARYLESRCARTAPDGRFELRYLLAGEYEVRVQAAGFRAWKGGVATGPDPHEIRLSAFPELVVRTRDADGRPVEARPWGCSVLHRASGRWSSTNCWPLPDGAVSEKGPGNWRILLGALRDPGMMEGVVLWASLPDGRYATSPKFSLDSGGPRHEVEIPFSPGWKREGRVVGPDGKAVAGAWVRYGPPVGPDNIRPELDPWNPLFTYWPGVQTSAEGRFVLRVTGAGPYEVRVMAEGYESPAGIWLEENRAKGGRDVEIKLSGAVRSPTVRGSVRDGAGRLVPGAEVRLVRHALSGADVHGETTDALGRFALLGSVRPGTYRVILRLGSLDLPMPEDRDWVEISGGDERELELVTSALVARVRGRILRDGLPWPGASVALVLLGELGSLGGRIHAVSGGDGSVDLAAVPAGSYRLMVGRGEDSPPEHFEEVSVESPVTEIRADVRAASVRGRVAIPEGQTPERLSLLVWPEGPDVDGLDISVPVGPDGGFALPALAPGTWQLGLRGAGRAWSLGNVRIAAGESLSDLAPQPEPARARIVGVVRRLADESPVVGAEVVAVDAAGAVIPPSAGSRPVTDGSGRFDLSLQWLGPVTLRVGPKDGEQSAETITRALHGVTVEQDLYVP